MRYIFLAVLSVMLVACGGGSSGDDIRTLRDRWENKMHSEVPVGTKVSTVLNWLNAQGIHTSPSLEKSKNIQVWLGSVKAREWFCDKWWVLVDINVTPKDEVASYEFKTIGSCL